MWETLATVRDLGRVQEIASVLVRYGFGDVVQRIGMAGALERAGRLLHIGGGEDSVLRLSPPERVRHALQDLGPTFVKLGQVLATRVDLLPPEWIDALGRLQSQVPAVPIESLALLVGIDRFMSECRALTNLIGNGVATVAISRWEGEVSAETIRANLARPEPPPPTA